MTNNENIQELYALYYRNEARARLELEKAEEETMSFQNRIAKGGVTTQLTLEQISDIMDKVDISLGVVEEWKK